MSLSLVQIEWFLYQAWSKESSYSPDDYEQHDKSYGQCAVTALLLQDILSGEIMRGWAINKEENVRVRHYWNRFGDTHVDCTWKQFPEGTTIIESKLAQRKQLLNHKSTSNRYKVLRAAYRRLDGST